MEFYNKSLQERKDEFKNNKKTITSKEQYKQITALKNNDPRYKNIHTHLLRDVLDRLDRAYDGFFRRLKLNQKAGFPRFKTMRRFKSFMFKDAGSINGISIQLILKDGTTENTIDREEKREKRGISLVSDRTKLRINGVTGLVKIKFHREMKGRLKTVSIKYDNGKWYAIFCRDQVECDIKTLPKTNKEVGGDYGISTFLTLTDGENIENPRILQKSECKLTRAQRKLSKRVKGSKRYNKARRILAKNHRYVTNCRNDFAHKETRKLVQKYDFIAIEDLNIENMKKKNKFSSLNKKISECAWVNFTQKLAYKVEETGRELVKVDPSFTSQDCSGCGGRKKKALYERIHFCKECGLVLHRDTNAARNILKRAKNMKIEEDQPKTASVKARTKPSRTGYRKPSLTEKPT
jgi:putative transposase